MSFGGGGVVTGLRKAGARVRPAAGPWLTADGSCRRTTLLIRRQAAAEAVSDATRPIGVLAPAPRAQRRGPRALLPSRPQLLRRGSGVRALRRRVLLPAADSASASHRCARGCGRSGSLGLAEAPRAPMGVPKSRESESASPGGGDARRSSMGAASSHDRESLASMVEQHSRPWASPRRDSVLPRRRPWIRQRQRRAGPGCDRGGRGSRPRRRGSPPSRGRSDRRGLRAVDRPGQRVRACRSALSAR
jgi:hypothetical protein